MLIDSKQVYLKSRVSEVSWVKFLRAFASESVPDCSTLFLLIKIKYEEMRNFG